MIRLRSYDQNPPGNYPYEQTEGIRRKFPAEPLIEAQAKTVAGFRAANGLPRASVVEALEDISTYTCQRLGGMSNFCINTDGSPLPISAGSPLITPCAGCGASV